MIIILNNLLFLLIIKLYAMTKQEAIQLMREGIKVKHRFFMEDEWVIMEDSLTTASQFKGMPTVYYGSLPMWYVLK